MLPEMIKKFVQEPNIQMAADYDPTERSWYKDAVAKTRWYCCY